MNIRTFDDEAAIHDAALIVEQALDAADQRVAGLRVSRADALRYQQDVLRRAADMLDARIRRVRADGRVAA